MKYLVFTVSILLFGTAKAVPFESQKFSISSPHPLATKTAERVLKEGGNIIDAAIAINLTLAVTSPYFASLGGGGFALFKVGENKPIALDFRETAPQKTHPRYYLDKELNASANGGAAVATPGIVAGLWHLHKNYGKLAWKKLFKEALDLSKNGFPVSGEWVRYTSSNKDRFNQAGREVFLRKNDINLKPADTLKQPALYSALLILRNKGAKGFYEGPIAKDIVSSVQATGGELDLKDLKNYKVRELKPDTVKFYDHNIYMMPPPSSASAVMGVAFQLAEKLKLKERKPLSVIELHSLAEILKRAFKARTLLGDPDYHKNPITHLLSSTYINELASTFKPHKSTDVKLLQTLSVTNESTETTNFSVMDSKGNAIAMTVTLNGGYGSGVVSQKYGIALNNEMDDFTTRPGEANQFGLIQGESNKIEAGKRPLSSMSPTLVLKDGEVVMAVGSPGGPRIISSVFQVIYRVLVNEFDMDQAIQAPRVHHQVLPNKLYIDPIRVSPDVIVSLEKLGHSVEESSVAKVYGVRKNKKGWLESAFDSRGEGLAGGL